MGLFAFAPLWLGLPIFWPSRLMVSVSTTLMLLSWGSIPFIIVYSLNSRKGW